MATKRQVYESQLRNKKFGKVPHQFTKRICHWVYCSGCGLVALNNEPTRIRISQGCESMEVLTAYENPTKSKEIG